MAASEVHEALTGDTLEAEFKQLGASSADESVEWRLLQLKERMGLPSAAGAERKALTGGNGGTTSGSANTSPDVVHGEEDGEVHEAEVEEER